MKWFVHSQNSAEAHADDDSHRSYVVERPYNVDSYFLVRSNGDRLANVDTMEEGMRLSEWHQRAMEKPSVLSRIES